MSLSFLSLSTALAYVTGSPNLHALGLKFTCEGKDLTILQHTVNLFTQSRRNTYRYVCRRIWAFWLILGFLIAEWGEIE
jgi:hypothetical protein